jgi:hypothetical protein
MFSRHKKTLSFLMEIIDYAFSLLDGKFVSFLIINPIVSLLDR